MNLTPATGQSDGDDRPFLLFVGKLAQRRNIPLLIDAFAHLKRHDEIPHGLLLCGPNHLNLPIEQQVRDLGVADSVVQTDGRFPLTRASWRSTTPRPPT